MKKINLFIIAILCIAFSQTNAQVQVGASVGPLWGPAGYPNAHYYYLPDVESYYDVDNSQFIYQDNGKWIHSSTLPDTYSNYDLYGGYKVVLDDQKGSSPYTHFEEHRKKYFKGYRNGDQRTIKYEKEHEHEHHDQNEAH